MATTFHRIIDPLVKQEYISVKNESDACIVSTEISFGNKTLDLSPNVKNEVDIKATVAPIAETLPVVPDPIHPQAILRDQGKLDLIAREIPYCMFRAYEVLERIVERNDAEAMYSFASCIVYLTAFCARMAHENSAWFAQKFLVRPEGPRTTDATLMVSTVGHETVRWVQKLANTWRIHVPERASIDIAEGARGLSMIPGLSVTAKMIGLVKACPDMAEWTQRMAVNTANKPSRWGELTLIMTLQWCIARDPSLVMRYCVEQICKDMPGSLQWMAPRKSKKTQNSRTKAGKSTGRGRKTASVKAGIPDNVSGNAVALFGMGEGDNDGCTSLLCSEETIEPVESAVSNGCGNNSHVGNNDDCCLPTIFEEDTETRGISTATTPTTTTTTTTTTIHNSASAHDHMDTNTTVDATEGMGADSAMLSPFDRIPTAFDPVLTSPYRSTRPQAPTVISRGTRTPFMPTRTPSASADAMQCFDATQCVDAVQCPGTPRMDSVADVTRLKASHSFKLEALQQLDAVQGTLQPTLTSNKDDGKGISALYTHSTEAFTISTGACKPHTITPGAEARIYCVTHMILVLSEFGTRPILHQCCSMLELNKMAQLLAQWMLLLAQDFPHSHAYNREVVVEIAASLLICKHNGVILAPKVLKALAATIDLLIDDVHMHGDNTHMRLAGPTARESVFVPIIAATQSRTDRGAMFAQYHTNYLVGMFFQLVIADTFGGLGKVNYPTNESGNRHCSCTITQRGKETCPPGTSLAHHSLYVAKPAMIPDALLASLPPPKPLTPTEAAETLLAGLEGPYPALFASDLPCRCVLCVDDSITVLPADCVAQLLSQCHQYAQSPVPHMLWQEARQKSPVDVVHGLPISTSTFPAYLTAHADVTVACAPMPTKAPETGRYQLDYAELQSRLGLWCDSYDCNAVRQTRLKLIPLTPSTQVNLFDLEQQYLADSHFDAREEFAGKPKPLKRKREVVGSKSSKSNKRMQT